MLSFLPGPVIAVIAALHLALNTLFWSISFYTLIFAKKLVPHAGFRQWCTDNILHVMENWIDGIGSEMQLLAKFKFHIEGLENLNYGRSYFICANHQSWVDIVLIHQVLNRRVRCPRFFLKSEILMIPVIAAGVRALDYPVMRRYSEAQIERDPSLRDQNLRATRAASVRWGKQPFTILNFLEGTRFSRGKQIEQKSPYQNLLKPKAGGAAIVIEGIGEQFAALLDLSLYYPGEAPSLAQFFRGEVREVRVKIEAIPIPRELIQGHYLTDPESRQRMHDWLSGIWLRKDRWLSEQAKALSQIEKPTIVGS